MMKISKLFYKLLFTICVRNKSKRKVFSRIFSRGGVAKYFAMKRLVAQEAAYPPPFVHEFSVACIAKNEGPYFKEWIEYHKMIGVDHFYVYNNDTEDNTKEIVQPYIDSGLVTWIDFPGKRHKLQDEAYCDAVARFKNETRWMCMIDLDEFIVLHKHDDIKDFMKDYSGYAQLSAYWMMYGSSGHKKTPQGLVLENFKAHNDEFSTSMKSVFNPRAVVDCGAHWMFVCGDWVDENKTDMLSADKKISGNKIQINHYFMKSEEEFLKRKAPKGCVDDREKFGDWKKFFADNDHNEVTDDLMMPYVERLKKVMGMEK